MIPTAGASETQEFRSQVGHISRQSGIFFAGTVFTAAFGYVFKVYLAHVLGAKELGIYALGVTLVGFVGLFNAMGLSQSAVRFVAAYQAAGKFRELHALLWRGGGILLTANILFAALLLVLGRWVAIRFYHVPVLVGYLPLFALMMMLGVISNFYGKVLAGYKDLTRRTLIVNFVGTPLMMLLSVVLIVQGLALRGYLIAQVVSIGIISLLMLVAVRDLTPAPARFTAHRGAALEKEIWSFSYTMLGLGFMEYLMVQVDKIALGFYRGAREVGIYSVAGALVVYVPLVLSSVNQIFAPTIADLHTRGDNALLGRLFQSLTKWVVGLTLPLAVVIIVFARPLMRIFGPDFEAGWPILVIGALGQLVNCGVGSVGFLLQMSGNEKLLIKVQVTMAVVMVALSMALVPRWGIVGAAMAAATTNVGMNVWNLLKVRTSLGLTPYNRSYWHLLPPTIAMLGVTLLLKRIEDVFHHNWLAVGVTMVSAYLTFAVIVLMFGLDIDDRLIASAIWSRVRGIFGKVPGVQP